MSGFDQSSIAVSMPTVVGADAALGGPYKIKPSEAFSGALMTVSGLTGETISVQTSPDGYWGAPASPSFYRTDWQGTQPLYSTARTNIALQSDALESVTEWGVPSGLSFTSTTAIAPDGTATAREITTSAVAVSRSQAIAVTASTNYVHSFWVKRGTIGELQYSVFNVTGGSDIIPSTSFYSLTNTSTWVRISIPFTTPVGCVAVRIYVLRNNTGTVGTFYSWGHQLELGSTPTPRIATTASAVTITDYTLSNGVITLAQAPVTGAALSYDNSVLPSPYYIFATGDGVRTQFAYDGVWGTLSANSGKGNGIWQVDLRGAQAYRLVKSAGSETATVNMTLKRDALQYKNTAGTWSVT